MVGTVCDGRKSGRAHFLSLSATADHDWRRGDGDPAEWKAHGRIGAGRAHGAVSGAASNGSAGWRKGAVLSELSACGQRAGVKRSQLSESATSASEEFKAVSQSVQ